MEEARPQNDSPPFTDRAQKAEIVDRLYEVALDPIHLGDLLDLWVGQVAALPPGRDEPLGDPEIAAHARRAQVFLERIEARHEQGGFRAVLAEIPRSAAFVSDGGSRIAACNRAARMVFGIIEGGPVAALPFDPDDIATLRDVIRKVASRRAEKVVTLRIRSVTTGSPVIMRVSPVHSEAPRPLALVLSTELVWPEGFEVTVQEAFGLTAAEVEIVQGITLGLPLKDIAGARGRSVETVRTQARSILAKTETHSQAELVRVVLGLMDLALIPADEAEKGLRQGGLKDRPFRHMQRPDGRRLEWIEFGDPTGKPVLFMHLDYGLIRWPAPAERAARRQGLRIVVPVRAGYGHSDPHPRAVDHLAGCTEDYAAVLDHLGIARAAVLCLGADLRFAMNLAITRPGLVSAILGCAAQLPLRDAAQYERMDKWQRFILANARTAPRVLPFLVQAGFSLARRMGKEAFFAQVNGGSPADMKTFADPQVRAAILAGSEVCLGATISAHEAFSRECISSERDWSGIVRACPAPVLLLQGDQDPQSPMQTIRELAADFPHLQVEFLPNTGQLLFFAEWRQVLERLVPLLPE